MLSLVQYRSILERVIFLKVYVVEGLPSRGLVLAAV